MEKKYIFITFFIILFCYAACFDEEGETTQKEYVYDEDNPNVWEAKEWTAENIPMVHLQDANRYVSDPEHIMQDIYRDSADMVLAQLERDCKIQSSFIIVNRVKNGDAFRVAQDIGNKYGVGDKSTNRGLVMVIAVEDHKSFIAPGRGLEGDLTDLLCGRIGDTYIAGNMRQNNPDQAVLQTCRAIYEKMSTGVDPVLDDGQGTAQGDDEFGWFDFIILAIIIILVIYSRGSGVYVSGGGSSGGWSSGGRGGGWSGGGGSYGGGGFGGGGAGSSW